MAKLGSTTFSDDRQLGAVAPESKHTPTPKDWTPLGAVPEYAHEYLPVRIVLAGVEGKETLLVGADYPNEGIIARLNISRRGADKVHAEIVRAVNVHAASIGLIERAASLVEDMANGWPVGELNEPPAKWIAAARALLAEVKGDK